MALKKDRSFEIAFSRRGKVLMDIPTAYLLSSIQNSGSLIASAQAAGMSVNEAVRSITNLGRMLGSKVAKRTPRSDDIELTAEGRRILTEYKRALKIYKENRHPEWKGPSLTGDGVVIKNGRVLLIKRGNPPWQGMWAIPGGYVEEDERPVECAIREVEEETGIRAKPLMLVGVYDRPDRDPRGHIITMAYLMEPTGTSSPKGGDDASVAKYHLLSKLPKLAADHARIVADAVEAYKLVKKSK